MSIYDNRLWIDDLDLVLKELPELKKIENQHIMITGAAGLICSAVTDVLIRYNETHRNKIHIYVAGRNEQKMKERFAKYYFEDYFNFVFYDSIQVNNEFNFLCDYIIHGATNSSPKKIINEPVETMIGNFFGIKYLLDFAKLSKVKRILYISSSEVYGKRNRDIAAKEDEYGFIDILNPRNSYSIGKQAAETLCISYADEYGMDSIIARPGHIYGPTANIADDHVSSSWVYDVVNNLNIVMKSDGSQIRSYVYCLDCASAILKILLCGEKSQAYNISNINSVISIKEMAEILCRLGNVNIYEDTPNSIDKKYFNPITDSSLDSTKLYNIGWKGCFDAITGFSHTIEILKGILC